MIDTALTERKQGTTTEGQRGLADAASAGATTVEFNVIW